MDNSTFFVEECPLNPLLSATTVVVPVEYQIPASKDSKQRRSLTTPKLLQSVSDPSIYPLYFFGTAGMHTSASVPFYVAYFDTNIPNAGE